MNLDTECELYTCPECGEIEEILIRHKETTLSYYTTTLHGNAVRAESLIEQEPDESIDVSIVCAGCYLTLSVPDDVEVDV